MEPEVKKQDISHLFSRRKNRVKIETVVWSTKCYGYIRVSTKKQEEEGMSLEVQEKKIRAWAVTQDLEIAEIFKDEGISGKNIEHRPGLISVLERIKTGETLVVMAFSRLSRSARDFLNIADELDGRGVRIAVMKEKFDTTDAYGRFTATMFSALSQLEREITSDRVKDCMAVKKEKGEFVGRIPFGWRLSNGPQSDLEEIPEEHRGKISGTG